MILLYFQSDGAVISHRHALPPLDRDRACDAPSHMALVSFYALAALGHFARDLRCGGLAEPRGCSRTLGADALYSSPYSQRLECRIGRVSIEPRLELCE
jgi:hypothetical protein